MPSILDEITVVVFAGGPKHGTPFGHIGSAASIPRKCPEHPEYILVYDTYKTTAGEKDIYYYIREEDAGATDTNLLLIDALLIFHAG